MQQERTKAARATNADPSSVKVVGAELRVRPSVKFHQDTRSGTGVRRFPLRQFILDLGADTEFRPYNFLHDQPQSRHSMKKRPLSVTVISWLFIAAGTVGLAYHLPEFKGPFNYELVWVCILRLLAILSGVFMLRGRNWARWLLLGWIVYHVILSAFHSLSELVMHGVLLLVVAYFLFQPKASAYFKAGRGPHQPAKPAGI